MPDGDPGIQMRVAVIAALAALGGGLIGGGASYLGTKQQIEAQAEQSEADFLRAERRSTYAQMTSEAATFYRMNFDFLFLLRPRPKAYAVPRVTVAQLRDQRERLLAALTDVMIIGADDVQREARALFYAYAESYSVSARIAVVKEEAAIQKRVATGWQTLQGTNDERDAFIAAARESLEVDGS